MKLHLAIIGAGALALAGCTAAQIATVTTTIAQAEADAQTAVSAYETALGIADARAAGTLIDDRAYPGGYREAITELTPHVGRLLAKYADRSESKHYTIADKE